MRPPSCERLDVRVYGEVQGVGFRPYVHGLARELSLTGWVRNDTRGVRIQIQGRDASLRRFIDGMRQGPPALARVERVELSTMDARPEGCFEILPSDDRGGGAAELPPDSAVCRRCLDELFDCHDRRYRYPFINCTDCGPRYTIAHALPYDRARTSMKDFALCRTCRGEYDHPGDRRFHAEASACSACGPQLALLDPAGVAIDTTDPVSATAARLRRGDIVAIKGIGGFHLACDARNAAAVAHLRARKHREARPLGVMALNPASIAPYVQLDGAGGTLLTACSRPIVLLPKRAACDDAFAGIAPGVATLGVMLPYTPVHYLLFHESAGRPNGRAWLDQQHAAMLVMTSANPSGEPLVIDNDEALERLAGIADAVLLHDRAIAARCDDSVVQVRGPLHTVVRRSRGYVPRAIALPAAGPSVLALGGALKSTVCVTRGRSAYLSPHIGDLGSVAAGRALERCAAGLLALFALRPEVIAHDLHPDYESTALAQRLARHFEVPAIAVQHHHAHVAAVAADHGLDGAVLGLALDGVGLGTDGGAWGGELLLADRECVRLGHLRPLALPGGDRAAREPWRMAASVLHALGEPGRITARYPGEDGNVLRQMLDRGLNSPPTSSAGRVFDAAAALLGIRERSRYEGEAAMNLEAHARTYGPVAALASGYVITADNQLDLLPLLAALADIGEPHRGAALFHATFAAGLADWVARNAETEGIGRIVLAGGCFQNALLSEALRTQLDARGFGVYEARQVPPNDGGLSLGQARVAHLQHHEGR